MEVYSCFVVKVAERKKTDCCISDEDQRKSSESLNHLMWEKGVKEGKGDPERCKEKEEMDELKGERKELTLSIICACLFVWSTQVWFMSSPV